MSPSQLYTRPLPFPPLLPSFLTYPPFPPLPSFSPLPFSLHLLPPFLLTSPLFSPPPSSFPSHLSPLPSSLLPPSQWSHSLEKPSSGTVLKLAWTSDGTQFAGACGNGQVMFAQVVDR